MLTSCPFSVLSVHPGTTLHLVIISPQALFGCGRFPHFLFLMILLMILLMIILRDTSQGFCRISVNLGLSDVLLLIELGLSALRRSPQRWSTAPVLPHRGHILSTGLVTADVNSDQLTEVTFVKFLHCKFLLSFLSILNSLEGSHCAHPTLKELCFTSLKVEGAT